LFPILKQYNEYNHRFKFKATHWCEWQLAPNDTCF